MLHSCPVWIPLADWEDMSLEQRQMMKQAVVSEGGLLPISPGVDLSSCNSAWNNLYTGFWEKPKILMDSGKV